LIWTKESSEELRKDFTNSFPGVKKNSANSGRGLERGGCNSIGLRAESALSNREARTEGLSGIEEKRVDKRGAIQSFRKNGRAKGSFLLIGRRCGGKKANSP